MLGFGNDMAAGIELGSCYPAGDRYTIDEQWERRRIKRRTIRVDHDFSNSQARGDVAVGNAANCRLTVGERYLTVGHSDIIGTGPVTGGITTGTAALA